ncbi:hypothetical protein DMA12_46405 [Amycolatopsis balhimycina DSM 5908]|uniref:PE domain-containing protein n=1 Tax=Amycolatopsis balhimycina DSM 5908 TaxID=1081091 RepID=A0A428VVW9_AMYBA|nr:hypothetical protein [Amycolatopsis balhimycina]RSM34892.1 hypothetical protein DMA12_46405 [Amycolatopsis balhimycina DSM 5908]
MLIADGGGGSMSDIVNPLSSGAMKEAVQSVTAETQKLVAAASSGGFRISPEGVEPIRKALKELIDDLGLLSNKVANLNQAPKLGNHPYGHTVAAHDHKGAADAEGSAGVVLNQLMVVAQQADKALGEAAAKYSESENTALDHLKAKH